MGNSEPVIDLEDLEMTPLLRRVIVFSSGGPFLGGYVLSVVGVALGAVGSDFTLDTRWNGLLDVSALVGLFLGASFGGWLTGLIGRCKMFVIDLVVIAILSILCVLIHTPLTFVALRLFADVAAGADYPIAASMITEFSSRRYRAATVGIIAAAWYLGTNVAAPVGFALINTSHG